MEAAGWKAVKEGRRILGEGGVSGVGIQGKLVRGMVKIGRRNQVAGLKVNSAEDLDNLCRCPESLRSGIICGHSVAVALAAAELQRKPLEKAEGGKDTESSDVITAAPKTANSLVKIILEPIFTDLWEKNRVPLRLAEFQADGGGGKDGGEDEIFHQSGQIRQWVSHLGGKASQKLPPFLVLNRKLAGELWRRSAGYAHLQIGDDESESLSIADQEVRLKLQVSQIGESDRLRLSLPGFADGSQVLLRQSDPDASPWVYNRGQQQLWPVRLPESQASRKMLHGLLEADTMTLPVSEPELATMVTEWSDVFDLEAGPGVRFPELVPGQPEFELYLEGSLNHVTASIRAFYGQHELVPGKAANEESTSFFPYRQEDRHGLANKGGPYLTRNLQAELTALHQLTGAGFSASDQSGRLHLRGRNEVLHFHVSVVPRLRKKWRRVEFGERYRGIAPSIRSIRPVVEFSPAAAGEDWFSCRFEFADAQGQGALSESEVRRLLATGQNQVGETDDGSLLVLDRDACDDWFEVLRDCNLQQESGQFRIANAQRAYVESSLEHYQHAEPSDDNTATGRPGLQDSELAAGLGDLDGVLRSYQREGVAWLYRKLLPENGGGAVLADEMGLGKTLQTLAVARLLQARAPRHSKTSPILVVCPTSLIDNWAEEARKFVPQYKVLPMRGPKRSGHFKNLQFADLVITSYALIIRDIDHYREHLFRLAVLDEASYIRNPTTRNARSVKQLNAESRLALTGTPIENSVLDIWSISDFVRPGYLGSREEFKQHYEKPINSGKASVQLHQRFRRRLQPTILRRTKRKVASDLPEKLNETIYCRLNDKQQAYYASILRESRKKIEQAFSCKDERAARANMLTALLRLRQICCDPRLLEAAGAVDSKTEPKSPNKPSKSAKMELLQEKLQESAEGGHRVLVFSQFVGMLKLIRRDLEQAEFFDGEIAYLDGSSQDRAAQVERFQSDESVKVFLISLKAGGYGLNLTGADTVIHYDPWWNPAVEAQATDRAHRIGQDKIVTSYKLIVRDTVEEKILQLQQRKRDIFDAAIDDDQPMMRGLNTEDLREILEV